MRPFRLIVIGGSGFGVLAMLLPFASFPVVGPVDGIAADAWPALLPLLAVVVIVLIGRSYEGLGWASGLAAVTASAVALVFSVVKLTDAAIAVRDTAGATLGPGAYVLIGAVVAVTGATAAGALAD